MAVHKISTAITETQTTKLFELGLEYEDPNPTDDYGLRRWIYVYNESGSALAVGDTLVSSTVLTSEDPWGVVIAGSGAIYAPVRVAGVAQHAIPASSYGWILNRGAGLVKCGSDDIAQDDLISTGGDRDGACLPTADPREAIGFALESVSTDNTTFSALLRIP